MHKIKWIPFIIVYILASISSQYSMGQYKSEADLIAAIVKSLQHEDSIAYSEIFAPSDTFYKAVYKNAPSESESHLNSKLYIDNPEFLSGKDSSTFKQSCSIFWDIIKKGDQLKLNWKHILLRRFELEALVKKQDDTLYASTERMLGYLFFEDALSQKIYTLTLNDVIKIGNYWYGGALNYLFEANSKEEFNQKLKAEILRIQKGLPPDTAITKKQGNTAEDDEEEEEPLAKRRRLALDRKYYFGYLDKEIPVSLYVRFIKGDCPEKVCAWDAILKYDENEYALQTVSKNEKGEWVFHEEENGYILEVVLKDDQLIGTYTATADNIEYDAKLKERSVGKKNLSELEALLENLMER